MKKLKGIWITFIIVVLSVIMAVGSMSLTAFAAGAEVTTSAVQIYSKLIYGETYDFSAQSAKITKPNGTEVNGTNNFVPDQVGLYTVKYGTNGEYSYTVNCVMDAEYELRVDYDGADIPSYMQQGGSFKVPAAKLFKKDDDGKWVPDTTATNTVTSQIIGKEDAATSAAATRDVTMTATGTYIVRYVGRIGATGTKYFSKDYEVKVQKTLSDSVRPSLSVGSMLNQISVNTKITVPTATATDNYDTNVKVQVSVEYLDTATGSWVGVKDVEIDDNGYATVKEGAEALVFDNKTVTEFYPTVTGDYRFVYVATDDHNNSTTSTFSKIKCVDSTAAILVDIDDSVIPTTWGVNVTKKDTGALSDTSIVFPYPDYIDNADGKDITVDFYITDTVNDQTVVRFDNIYDTSEAGAGRKYTYSSSNSASMGLYQPEGTVEFTRANGFKFNFSDYIKAIADKTYTGTYTATYHTRDKAGNQSRKSYDITLESSFSDTEAPSVLVDFLDSYLVVYDDATEFTIPTPTVTDNNDTRPSIEFTLFNSGDESTALKVKGGEVATLEMIESKPYLVIDEDNRLELDPAKGLSYKVVATDDVGNSTEVVADSGDVIQIIVASAQGYDALVSSVGDTGLSTDFTVATNSNNADKQKKVGDEVNLGKLTISLSDAKYRNFVGFEMALRDADNGGSVAVPGELSGTTLNFNTYFNTASGAKDLVIEDIKFTPAATEYFLQIRVFTVSGESKVFQYNIKVDPATGGGDVDISAATTIGTSGNVRTTYKLKNETAKVDAIADDHKYIIRNITSHGMFSLMGTEFTAYSAGKFRFSDGYYRTNDDASNKKVTLVNGREPFYEFSASDTQTVAWEVQGVMPVVGELTKSSEENAPKYIELPAFVASTEFANATVTVVGTTPRSGRSITVPAKGETASGAYNFVATSDGGYKFYALEEGEYKITYTAAYGSSSAEQTFTIKVGDNEAPVFTLASDHAARMKEGDTFTFKSLNLTTEDNVDYDEYKSSFTYKKRLIDYAGTVVYEVEQTGESGRTATYPSTGDNSYTFTKTGTYTIEYSVTDRAGNESLYSVQLEVSASKTTNPVSVKIISTVLIIVGVLLIAGVILYFVRFRKVKTK